MDPPVIYIYIYIYIYRERERERSCVNMDKDLTHMFIYCARKLFAEMIMILLKTFQTFPNSVDRDIYQYRRYLAFVLKNKGIAIYMIPCLFVLLRYLILVVDMNN